MRLTLKWKFTLFVGALLLFAIGVLSVLALDGIRQDQRRQMENELSRQAKRANLRIVQTYVTGDRLDPDTFMRSKGQALAVDTGMTSGMPVILYDRAGNEVGNSVPMVRQTGVKPALGHALQSKIAYITKGDTLVYLAPLQGPDGLLGVVQFQSSLADQQAFYRSITALFLKVGLSVVALAFMLGALYMSRQARAIKLLKEAADAIRHGRYIAAPVLKRKDELGELGDGIYTMSREIETNVSALQEEKRKLELAVGKLRLLERQQKQFIGNISHEFKTPLTSIKAYADLLDMYKDDRALIQDARDAIDKESSRLYELVDKVLQLAALDKYDFETHLEDIDLKQLLDDLCGRMKGKAEKFEIGIATDLEPAIVRADRESLIHIFVNLLDNAIKYNVPNGRIIVISKVAPDKVVVEVRDTGIGIPEEVRDKIFEPFYTVNKHKARLSGGSGLGLALVKQLVEKQNGAIVAESADGGGTAFVVVFFTQKLSENLQV